MRYEVVVLPSIVHYVATEWPTLGCCGVAGRFISFNGANGKCASCFRLLPVGADFRRHGTPVLILGQYDFGSSPPWLSDRGPHTIVLPADPAVLANTQSVES